MRLRLHCRTRTILIAVALASLPLAYTSAIWRKSGFAFQRRHAALASEFSYQVGLFRCIAEGYRRHAAPGHSCPVCREYARPLDELISEAERLQRENQREGDRHRFWAGPSWESTLSGWHF